MTKHKITPEHQEKLDGIMAKINKGAELGVDIHRLAQLCAEYNLEYCRATGVIAGD